MGLDALTGAVVGAGLVFATGGVGAAAYAAGIGAGAAVGGQVEAARQNEIVQRQQRKLQQIQAQRQIQESLRQSRIARAVAVNRAASAGTGTSSGLVGVQSSIFSRTAGNVGFFGQSQEIGSNISRASQRASNAQTIATIGQSIFDVTFPRTEFGRSLGTN